MGSAGESRMTSHQQKKLETESLRYVRDRFQLPLTDEQVANLEFYRPPADSPEMRYLLERRQASGRLRPVRNSQARSRCRCRRWIHMRSSPCAPKARRCPPPWRRCALQRLAERQDARPPHRSDRCG